MAKGKVNEYLENKGVRHFMALVMVFYILGTVIFNIYLRSLGVFEFELLQIRYVFSGIVFAFFTAILISIFWMLKAFFWPKKKPKKTTKKEREKEMNRLEIDIFLFVIPWIVVYALYIFPLVPSGFGGAKPIEARLIGEKETIQKVNALIAHETEVEEEKLPFEIVSETSNLAIGANVRILDRNRDRILLILTKELYLSSTSKLAKELIESGTNSEKIAPLKTERIKPKTLLVKADQIESITFSLYEPPDILTKEDLEIAAEVLAAEPEVNTKTSKAAKEVEEFITEQAPETATRILAAVKKFPKSTIEPDFETPPPTKAKITEEVEEVLNEFFDTKFLNFRRTYFQAGLRLHDQEKFLGVDDRERALFAEEILRSVREKYPTESEKLTDENYLVTGQEEKNFPWRAVNLFRGTENIEDLIERINNTQPVKKETAEEITEEPKEASEEVGPEPTTDSEKTPAEETPVEESTETSESPQETTTEQTPEATTTTEPTTDSEKTTTETAPATTSASEETPTAEPTTETPATTTTSEETTTPEVTPTEESTETTSTSETNSTEETSEASSTPETTTSETTPTTTSTSGETTAETPPATTETTEESAENTTETTPTPEATPAEE